MRHILCRKSVFSDESYVSPTVVRIFRQGEPQSKILSVTNRNFICIQYTVIFKESVVIQMVLTVIEKFAEFNTFIIETSYLIQIIVFKTSLSYSSYIGTVICPYFGHLFDFDQFFQLQKNFC